MAMISSSSTIAAVMTVAVLFAAGGRLAEGQADCAAKLVPCAEYLNSTTPSTECCDAMKTVVTTQLPCLCGLLKNPTALGVNMTQALELPKYCNLPSDTSACKATAQAPGSSSLPPPVTPGGNDDGNTAVTTSRMGMSSALLFVSAFVFFY